MSTTIRTRLWDQARGADEYPLCNLCGLVVRPGDRWDESHMPIAKCFGGVQTGVAHARCNKEHGAKVVVPMLAKSDRVRARYIGAYRSRYPMQGGRDDPRSRKMSGEVVSRETGERWR